MVGAGKLGAGIALAVLLASRDVAVVVKEIDEKVLLQCGEYVEAELLRKESSLARERLVLTLEYADLAGCAPSALELCGSLSTLATRTMTGSKIYGEIFTKAMKACASQCPRFMSRARSPLPFLVQEVENRPKT